jgi:serine/threonine-protein kinase
LLQLAAAPAPAFDAALEADASRHARVRSTPSSSAAVTSDPVDGQRIGAWRVVQRVGHGGMGTVFLVERADGQYEQRGALKLVHAHAVAADAHQRFARERRILASLDHAHVARLLDGGQTEDGRLYFVMEYVEGRPIDRFCDETRATIDRRLELFQKVCAGVQHAHDRLVVHRDLKPSNILVTDAGDVKLLDFGIAKLLSDDTAAPATRLLTPEYASPEQWRGDPVAIASDVYQLGLLLYELLTGEPAQSLSSGDTGTPRSIERIVCDTIPAQPSTRVKAGDPSIAAARRISRPALARTLSGDLDNITLFALRKEPGRRYASVRELADDVQRHRAGRPVRARGDDVLYRIGKFTGRHRIAVAVAAVALVAGDRRGTALRATHARSPLDPQRRRRAIRTPVRARRRAHRPLPIRHRSRALKVKAFRGHFRSLRKNLLSACRVCDASCDLPHWEGFCRGSRETASSEVFISCIAFEEQCCNAWPSRSSV